MCEVDLGLGFAVQFLRRATNSYSGAWFCPPRLVRFVLVQEYVEFPRAHWVLFFSTAASLFFIKPHIHFLAPTMMTVNYPTRHKT